MMISAMAEVSGRFSLAVDGPRGSRRYEFDNLITDIGLEHMASGLNIDRCELGRGTTPPSPEETGLALPVTPRVSSSSTVTGNSGGEPWYTFVRKTFVFDAGSVSEPVTEVAIFYSLVLNSLFSRALIRDANGNATTVEVRSDETLTVTYELRKWPPTTDQLGSFQLDVFGAQQTINYTLRAANVNDAASLWLGSAGAGELNSSNPAMAISGDILGPVTASPAGTLRTPTSASLLSYQAGSRRRRISAAFAMTTAQFPDGVGSMIFGKVGTGNNANLYGFQVAFSPKLPTVDGRTLGVKLFVSWGRR